MSYKKNISLLLIVFFWSCTSIPKVSSKLTKDVISQADNMHQLNIALVNKLFNERRKRLNTFITNIYTPAIIEKYQNLLPTTIDYKKQLPNIVKSIIPVINRKRDSLQNLLDVQEQRILTNLNTNFINYTKASTSLQNLIESVVKLKTSEDNALFAVNNFTENKLDLKKIESSLDTILNKTSSNVDIFFKIKKDLNLKQK